MKNFAYFFSITFLVVACDKNSLESGFVKKESNHVQFSNLQRGQQSFYVRYSADCSEADYKLEWPGDTLSLRVVEKESQLFFEESFTKFSFSYLEYNSKDTLFHPVSTDQQNLYIPERGESRLFYFYGNDTLRLDYLSRSRPKAFQEGCRIVLNDVPFEGDEIVYIDKFELGNREVFQLDRTVVSCIPTFIEEEAYLMYDFNQLYLSHTYYHSEFAGVESIQINGWQLIED